MGQYTPLLAIRFPSALSFEYNAVVLRFRTLAAGVLALAALMFPRGARSQEIFLLERPRALDVQLFEPSPSPRSILSLDTASVPSHLSLTVGLWSSYALGPFRGDLRAPDGTLLSSFNIVQHLFQTEAHLSLGLFEYFEVGLAMPAVFTSSRPETADHTSIDLDAATELQGAFRPGDLRVFVKIPFLRGNTAFALRAGASFPTGFADAFNGNVGWTFTPAAVFSQTAGILTFAANLGFRFRQRNGFADFALDDELIYGVGARLAFTQTVGLNAEVNGRFGLSAGGIEGNRIPLEALLGAYVQPASAVQIHFGIGRGLSGGYGSEDFRGFVGVRLTATRSSCTSGPEDFDGFQDGDFCADPDNDNDGILDAADRCPNDAEDRDGILDEDGCPDPDNDSDGVLDDNDRCPVEPEDRDGFDDTDGCPEGDNDRDGVPDATDQCPREPEDPDGYQDDDGCPEPGPEAVTVTRTDTHLLLSQRVFFDYDRDTIRDVSLPILNEVANTLNRNPDITRVRVEGYTDGQGDLQYNMDLSVRRARAVVEYMVSRGVNRGIMEFRGYGSTHYVADDSTPEGQALNRRVEFTIVAQHHAAAPTPQAQNPPPGGGETPGTTGRRRRRRHAVP